MNTIFALLAAASLIVVMVTIAVKDDRSIKNAWLVPGLLCVAFLGFSLYAVVTEGPTGFWTEHVRNNWGNQIWFDLLMAVGIAWHFVVPQAKASGMRMIPWMILILSTGCIGFLAMVSRLLYLKEHAGS